MSPSGKKTRDPWDVFVQELRAIIKEQDAEPYTSFGSGITASIRDVLEAAKKAQKAAGARNAGGGK